MEEGAVNGEQVIITEQQSAELPQPGVVALDLPSFFLALQFPDLIIAYSFSPPFRPITPEEDKH